MDRCTLLASAENIARGKYGVNAEEFSSPSSSILFPILLTPMVMLGYGRIGILIFNSLAAGMSVWLLLEFYWKRAVRAASHGLFPHLFSGLLILAINADALLMTGMEHSLHVLLVIVTMRGLVELIETGKVSFLLFGAVLCMPFVRFEGLAFAGAAILAMGMAGHGRAAGLVLASITAGFIFHGLVMHKLGLPFLPSSVLVKSNVAANIQDGWGLTRIATGLLINLRASFNDRWGILFAMAICAALFAVQNTPGRWRWSKAPEFLIGEGVVLALTAHLLAGRYDWFHRYEVYAVAVLVSGGIYILRPWLLRVSNEGHPLQQAAVLAAMAVFVSPYAEATVRTPFASRGIYEQQFQMHRFATEFFSRNVAVNDLGWVSYENENFVLDLWGLGSEKIRKLRALGRFNTEIMAKATADANVDYAMIYDSWFEDIIPKTWCLMAVLEPERVTVGSGRVSFYAVRPSVYADMNDALTRFAPTLPERVSLTRISCN
jgi:hypothetical protein